MSAPILTFFNNKGGVGKTSLVYHLAWSFADLGKQVVVVDLDPQTNLSAAFLDEERIGTLWETATKGTTIYRCVRPLTETADIDEPSLQHISHNLFLLLGEIALSGFEDALAEAWPKSLDDANLYRPMRILSAFWHVMQTASQQVEADIILVDIGPNLGAINRSALLATDYVAIPLGADLFSLQGLMNLGPTLRRWRDSWKKRRKNWSDNSDSQRYPDFQLPPGEMRLIGYLCQQYSVRLTRPVQAYEKWVNRIPVEYRKSVLDESDVRSDIAKPADDNYCLATIKHYRSLIPMAQEHRKPIFKLTPADGAIGGHANAVRNAQRDFRVLTEKIANLIGVKI